MDADIELPADVQQEAGDSEVQFYAVPQRGQPPTFHWPNNSRLVADHVVAGSFESAARLLVDQLGIVRLEPFKQLFLTAYARFVGFCAEPLRVRISLYSLCNSLLQ